LRFMPKIVLSPLKLVTPNKLTLSSSLLTCTGTLGGGSAVFTVAHTIFGVSTVV
jgi:hypothetical protein